MNAQVKYSGNALQVTLRHGRKRVVQKLRDHGAHASLEAQHEDLFSRLLHLLVLFSQLDYCILCILAQQTLLIPIILRS